MAGRPVHTFEVVHREQLTDHMVRLVLGANGDSGFGKFSPNEFSDAYAKLVIVPANVDVSVLPKPLTLDSFQELPVELRPTVRTYTVRKVDRERGEITIDFVVHGEQGVAAPWAAAAVPGQPAYLMGPSGAYTPDPAADWHLLAGDESHCRPSVPRWRRYPTMRSARFSSRWPALPTKSS
ncbi:siderophore-interacting protein [Mycolicibacterium conceptionense]|uniref:Siderophore-interacting protein n=1 Tax=Mycolicibacterium conceptionense TaxID=451644 RepID=A0A0U1E1C3_9MYCO|nr:siderophore-interacting protein [Mycolicibacterium conceptionense]